MKQLLITLIAFCFSTHSWAQQNNDMLITTQRIGPYKINMSHTNAEKIATKKIKIPSEQNEYDGTTLVNYNNETIELNVGQVYEADDKYTYEIYSIAIQSPNFQTLSGIKIGSTRDQLIDAYKDFSNFSMHPQYNDEGKPSKTDSYFSINDYKNETTISFILKNNKVVKITVSVLEEGCC